MNSIHPDLARGNFYPSIPPQFTGLLAPGYPPVEVPEHLQNLVVIQELPPIFRVAGELIAELRKGNSVDTLEAVQE